MTLVLESSKDFGTADYWEKSLKTSGEKACEWYGSHMDLCGVLHKYIAPKDKILVIGCGNSELSEQMYDVGYQDIVNIDISKVVISQMKERNSTRRPKMAYLTMDLMQMEFGDSHFQVVLDKGTLDAIMTNESEKTLESVDRMFSEIGRVLQVDGHFVCISLAQEHILRKLVDYFSGEGWMVRVHKITENAVERQFVMPVFVFVCTKFRKIPGSSLKTLEICVDEQDRPVQFESVESLIAAVKERQHCALLMNQLKKRSCDNASLNLCDKETGQPRYTLHVVDSPTVKPSHENFFAIFVIPQGKETDWQFASKEGRRQLAQRACFQRLIVLALHRDQQYEGLQAIQEELCQKVMELAPPGLPADVQVPFLSDGGNIGVRTVQHRGTSASSGDYVIQDVKGEEGQFFRQLIFLRCPQLVQTLARLMPTTAEAAPGKKEQAVPSDCPELPSSQGQTIDKSYLCYEHQKAMVAGLAFLELPEPMTETPLSVLVVGLGGGSLPLFIHDYFQQTRVEVVDIDPFMLEVATQWFGFSQDDRLTVHICDGLNYIQRLAESDGVAPLRPALPVDDVMLLNTEGIQLENGVSTVCRSNGSSKDRKLSAPAQKTGDSRYHAIMFDIDSKDLTVGMSCPAPAFVEKSFLQTVRSILMPQGVFILNLICMDIVLKEKVIAVLKEVFPLVYLRRFEDDETVILFCTLNADQKIDNDGFLKLAQTLENKLKRPGVLWDSTYSLSEMLQAVTLV